jgi:DNA polymerase-3 subunit gamma/tau
MFASTEPSGFPPAILSRLQRFDVRRLTIPEIEGKLTRILESDGREIEPEALTLIARLAAGGMRDAESILDQLLSMAPGTITAAAVRDLLGLADAAAVAGFVEALLGGDVATGIGILDALEERGRDPRALLDQVVDEIRARLVAGAADDPMQGAALARVARRLVAIDPDRAGIGGLRLQLELALFGARDAAVAMDIPPAPRTDDPRPLPPSTPPEPAAAEPASTPRPERAESEPAATPEPGSAREPAATQDPAHAPEPAPALEPPPAPEPAPALEPGPAPDEPVPATPEPVAETTPGASTELSLDGVVAAWPDIVTLLSRQPAIKQLIITCRPVALDGSIVTLGYPEEQAFLREIAERKKAGIEAGMREVIGHDVGVRCVVANIEVPSPPEGDEGFLLSEAKRIFGGDLVDAADID